ncbi:M protein [avian paramyxovirus 11]|uniref:Matrix protein n=1 Tax=avian paramyxovirus 11 TaxID=2560310 RepID=I6UTP1_9MONO|nr:M protein [Avian paramyxovirus 11]AFN06856.1 M protein [Avian paramyxovirus 11]
MSLDHPTEKINLPIPTGHPDLELLAFPIIVERGQDGQKTLQRQYRIGSVGDIFGSKETGLFLTCYGFIEESYTSTIQGKSRFFSEHQGGHPKIVTAALLPLGCVNPREDIDRLIEDSYTLKVLISKNVDSKERVVFKFVNKPAALSANKLLINGGVILDAEAFVKCPSKLTTNMEYSFRVVFVSVTRLDQTKLYRVNESISKIRNPHLIAVNLEVKILLHLTPDNPQLKFLIKHEKGGVGSVWIHLCNFAKKNMKGTLRSIQDVTEKVKRMALAVSLEDLWGPTVIVRANGTMSKYALGFFSTSKTACHPIYKLAPEIAKIMWSCSSEIIEANIIVQGSMKNDILTGSDLEIPSTSKIVNSGHKQFFSFKK